MFISRAHSATLGPSGGRDSCPQAGDEEQTWKVDAKSCTGTAGTADRRDEGMGSLWYCWTRSTPEDARERSIAPYSTTTERPSGLWFQSVFSYLPVSNVDYPAVYQGRHKTYPMSLLFVFFSGKEIWLRGPLDAMGCSIGDLIAAGQGPLPFIDVGWKESYPYKRHFKLHEQQDTYSDFLNGWTHQQPQHMLVEQAWACVPSGTQKAANDQEKLWHFENNFPLPSIVFAK